MYLYWRNVIISHDKTLALGIGRNETQVSEAELSRCGSNFCPWSISSQDNETNKGNEEKTTASGVEDNFETTKVQIYTLASIYLACSLLAPLIISLFVDPLRRWCLIKQDQKCTQNSSNFFSLTGSSSNESEEVDNQEESQSSLQLLVATFKQMRKKDQLLLIPLTLWSGLEQGFFGADFTAVNQVLFDLTYVGGWFVSAFSLAQLSTIL